MKCFFKHCCVFILDVYINFMSVLVFIWLHRTWSTLAYQPSNLTHQSEANGTWKSKEIIPPAQNDLFGCEKNILSVYFVLPFISWRAARSQWAAIKSINQNIKTKKSQILPKTMKTKVSNHERKREKRNQIEWVSEWEKL